MHVRHCTRCGADYRPEIAHCAECDLPLQDRYDEEDGRFRASGRPAADPEGPRLAGTAHTLYFTRDLESLLRLQERLTAEGIPSRIASQPEQGCSGRPTLRHELQVGEPDAPRSRRILDAGEGVPEEFQGAIDRDFDPERGYLRCPACRAALEPGQTDCRDCGLQLGGDAAEEAPSCGDRHAGAGCPRCGPSRPRR